MVAGNDQDLLSLRLEYFDLSRRTHNCLDHAGIETIGALVALHSGDVLTWPNAGEKTLEELRFLLKTVGLSFPDDSPGASSSLNTVAATPAPDPEVLLRRLDKFDLSTRAANCLVAANVRTVGELVRLRSLDVARWPNAGKKTVTELRALLGRLGLKFVDDQMPTFVPAEEEETDQATSIEEELLSIVMSVTTDRNAEIVTKLWGWNGKPPRTLDSVGREYGITRERVRQIEKVALTRLRRRRIATPMLHAAIAALKSAVPNGVSVLSRSLLEQSAASGEFSIESVRGAAQLLQVDWPFDIIDLSGVEILVHRDEAAKYKKLTFALRRKTSQRGCANLLILASDLDLDDRSVPGLRRLLSDLPEVEWLDQSRDWLYSTKSGRNRLQNLCAKVLGVAPRVHLSELRRAVSKARRLGMCPPQRVLGAFVESCGLGVVLDSTVEAIPGAGAPPQDGSAEALMLQVLDKCGPVMDGEMFAERCISAGMNATTFYIVRTISPVITPLGKNIFCRVGADVPPGTVEELARRRKVQPQLLDQGWSSKGYLWFLLHLTRQVITSGGNRLPAFVKNLVQGDWEVVLPDASTCGRVTCRDLFLWSARKTFDVLGAEPNDIAAFEFDLKGRQVHIRVGGQEVYEAIQHPDISLPDEADEE